MFFFFFICTQELTHISYIVESNLSLAKVPLASCVKEIKCGGTTIEGLHWNKKYIIRGLNWLKNVIKDEIGFSVKVQAQN